MRRNAILGAALILAAFFAVQGAAAAERVTLRVGEHPGFDRLVFDWARPVGVELEPGPDRALLRFDRAGELDLRRLLKDPPPSVRKVVPEAGAGGLNVVVEIAPGSKLRLLESGNSTVLDILRPDTPVDAPAAKRGATKTAKAPPKPAQAAVPKSSPEPAPKNAAKDPVASPVVTVPAKTGVAPPIPLTDRIEGQATPPNTPHAGSLATRTSRASAPPANLYAPVPLLAAPPKSKGPATKSPTPGETKTAAASRVPVAPPRAKPARTVQKVGAQSKSKAVKKSDSKGEDGGAARLLVLADQELFMPEGTGFSFLKGPPRTLNNLRFQWDAEAALAVFRRGPHLWLVFDRAAHGDVTAALSELVPELAPIEQFDAPEATLLRLTAPPILEPHIEREGTTWVVALWPRSPRPAPVQEIGSEGERQPSGVEFTMQMPGRIVAFADPSSGAPLMVVPAAVAGQGLTTAQTYPQFQALRSLQGLALEIVDESVQVSVAAPGVRITHPDGIVLSHGASLARLKSNLYEAPVGPRMFDLPAWRRGPPGRYLAIRQALQAELAQADTQHLPAVRLDLARFYFAHGFVSEAGGLLDFAEAADPVLPIDPEIRLMRGIARFLGGDYNVASKDLFHPSLHGESEAELWNGAMAAVAFDWEVAVQKFEDHGHLIADYPRRVRMGLLFMAAEAELATGDLETASAYLAEARKETPSLDERSQIAVLRGYIDQKNGAAAKARGLWQQVVQFSEHRPSQTRARLALLDLAVSEQRVTAAQAIEELERLRFTWRGDHIELALLQRLGDLYMSQRRYRESLKVYRQATASVPNSYLARDVAQRMGDAFFDIIAGAEGSDMAPISALALYQEFKELTPPGVKGDQMLSRLADRLIEVDLLPRAADLLTALVRFRLSGEEKAAVGARVATLHMHEDQPEQAIAALGLSEEGGLPDELKRRRVYLRAQALSRLARYEEATILIGADTNPEALRLRADILWEQANWPAAALILAQLVPEQPRADLLLSDAESRNVVDLAVALTLAGETQRLAALDAAYKEAMASGPDREAFALLTEDPANRADVSIAEQLAAVTKVEDFMTRYRDGATQTN